ncbi:MAG: hypothetical protein RL610_1393 [Pseudomonadota bacterium]
MLNFKGMRFPIDVILVCIRWYVAYPLIYRHLEDIMEERGVSVDHSSINRWAVRFLPVIEKMSRKHKRPVGTCRSWYAKSISQQHRRAGPSSHQTGDQADA